MIESNLRMHRVNLGPPFDFTVGPSMLWSLLSKESFGTFFTVVYFGSLVLFQLPVKFYIYVEVRHVCAARIYSVLLKIQKILKKIIIWFYTFRCIKCNFNGL